MSGERFSRPGSPIDEPALLAQQRGFAQLRFSEQLEPGFLEYLHAKMCSRTWVVGGACILFMLLFVWVDRVFLPEAVSRFTVFVRLLVLALVCFILWYVNRPGKVSPLRAFAASLFGYVSSGLMVVLVIITCRLAEVAVPVTHDGLYLILLSGLFLLGLPMRHAVMGSWIIVLGYIGAEYAIGAEAGMLISLSLFLGSFTLIGSMGAYLYEYLLRSAYLNGLLLEAARRRAERESQGKTRFLATASHDLRQPLHAMTLFIQHLEERVEDPQARYTVQRLADSTQLLQAMLNSLLDISRLSVGMVRPQLRGINLQPLLQQLVGSLEVSAREKGIQLQLICSPFSAVHSDPLLLERLLRNYLINALTHAQASEVRVEVSRSGERYRLAVVDNGRGMSDSEQERIFEEFTQLHNPARTLDKGVGLGLSICRQLLHLLEYPSGLQSAPGQGARFWFEVPLAEWQAEPVFEQAISQQALSGKVLLVENDRVSREAMETLLQHWGCTVFSCESAEQALQMNWSGVELLFTDYQLEGGIDGLTLIRSLRQQGRYSGPAVLITADTSEALQDSARLTDADIIYKPVLPVRLRRMMQRLMNGEPAGG